jgi:membrane complex biogenesis BtpA family protein
MNGSNRHGEDWQGVFGSRMPIIAMVHLVGLPGSPMARPMEEVLARASAEAELLARLGYDALLVENYGDLPFQPGRSEEHTIVAMTLAAHQVASRCDLPLGINVLRNDPISALAIASLVRGRFIRINVHTGVRAADQGLIEGRAHDTLRYRKRIGSDAMIFADVAVKHSKSVDEEGLEDVARETAYRGLADALIVTGPATGVREAAADLEAVRRVVPDRPILVGSGATSDNIGAFLELADGVIVGSDLKEEGKAERAVDPARAERFLRAAGR